MTEIAPRTRPTGFITRPAAAVGYTPWQWMRDRIAGRRDGRLGIADTSLHQEPSPDLRRNARLLDERCELERLRFLEREAAVIDRVRIRRRELVVAERELDERRRELSDAESVPVAVEASAVEQHLPPDAIRDRRRRERDAALAPLRARRQAADRLVDELRGEIGSLEGRVLTDWGAVAARVRRLVAHHERRAAHYCTAYLRQVARGGAAVEGHPIHERAPLTPPAWLTPECPWLD